MPENPAGQAGRGAAVATIAKPKRRALAAFESLSFREFRLLWLGMFAHSTAFWAESVARNWLTWEISHSGLALGLMNLFRAVPLLVFGALGGVVADRFDKRKTLMITQIMTLFIYVCMAILILGGFVQLWHIYVTAFFLGLSMAFNGPVRNSWIPELVDKQHLVNAVSLNNVAINSTRMIGPAIVGLVIGMAGAGVAYAGAAVIYVFVIGVTVTMKASGRRQQSKKTSMMEELFEGFHFAVSNKTILAMVILALGPLAIGMQYFTLLPVFTERVLHSGAFGFGVLQSAVGVGAVSGGLAVAFIGDIKFKGWGTILGALLLSVLVIALAVARWFPLAFIVLVGIGAAGTSFRSLNSSILFQITPEELKGRVISLTLLDTGLQPLGAILAGVLTDWISVSWALFSVGIICAAVVLSTAVAQPKIRRL